MFSCGDADEVVKLLSSFVQPKIAVAITATVKNSFFHKIQI